MSFLTNNALIRYFRGAKEELEKVTWPTRKTILLYSLLVMIVTLLWAIYFGALDFVLNLGLQAVVK